MDDLMAMKIGSAGMAAQRERMRVIAENLANQNTTGPNGPYQRKETIFESVPLASFESQLDSALMEVLTAEEIEAIHSVTVKEIVPDNSPPILRYEPYHPQADENGYVAYPNVSIVREMTDMIEASRSYEANLAVTKITREMLNKTIDLLG